MIEQQSARLVAGPLLLVPAVDEFAGDAVVDGEPALLDPDRRRPGADLQRLERELAHGHEPVRAGPHQVQPLIETLTLRGAGRAQALLRSFDDGPRRVTSPLPGASMRAYDVRGRQVDRGRGAVTLPPGGFAIAD